MFDRTSTLPKLGTIADTQHHHGTHIYSLTRTTIYSAGQEEPS